MQTLHASQTELDASRVGAVGYPVSVRWLVKRMALWSLIVLLTVASACLLYVAASVADSPGTTVPREQPAQTTAPSSN